MRDVPAGVLSIAEEEFDRLDAVADYDDLVREIVLAQAEQGQLFIVRIVFDEQDIAVAL